jgi:hypothetical protein
VRQFSSPNVLRNGLLAALRVQYSGCHGEPYTDWIFDSARADRCSTALHDMRLGRRTTLELAQPVRRSAEDSRLPSVPLSRLSRALPRQSAELNANATG